MDTSAQVEVGVSYPVHERQSSSKKGTTTHLPQPSTRRYSHGHEGRLLGSPRQTSRRQRRLAAQSKASDIIDNEKLTTNQYRDDNKVQKQDSLPLPQDGFEIKNADSQKSCQEVVKCEGAVRVLSQINMRPSKSDAHVVRINFSNLNRTRSNTKYSASASQVSVITVVTSTCRMKTTLHSVCTT